MPTIDVLDALGAPQAIEVPNSNGRRSASLSRPTVWSNEDLAAINALGTALSDILARLNDPLGVTQDGAFDVNITNAEIQATFTEYPGLTNEQRLATPTPVVDGSARIVWTQTVVTGTGSAVTVLSANANRKGIVFLPAGAENDWLYNFFGTAASGASPIYPPAGGPFVLLGRGCPTGALSLLGTTSQKLIVWEGN